MCGIEIVFCLGYECLDAIEVRSKISFLASQVKTNSNVGPSYIDKKSPDAMTGKRNKSLSDIKNCQICCSRDLQWS